METREIEKSQWCPFFDRFSRAHHGQRVTVNSTGSEFGVQANARNQPLLGITAEIEPDRPCEIEIMLGELPDRLVTHVIRRPRTVRIAEWNDYVSAAIQIEGEDGTTTLVQAGPLEQTLPPGCIVDEIDRPTRPRYFY